MINEKISDYITFPKTFENYKWYKPILVIIIGLILSLILTGIVVFVFYMAFGFDFIISVFRGGYEILNTEMGLIFTDLIIICIIPALYFTTKIVKDRPFSSYSSSRGGWNFKLYFKALVIPLILYMIYGLIDVSINGSNGTYHFSVLFLIVSLITVTLQCIAEEYVFRGLIMQTVGSWFNIPVLAIAIQAIFFAVLHGYNSIGLIEMLFTGLVYGFFAWKANGLEVCSAIHTANNISVSLLVMFGLRSSSSNLQLYNVLSTIIFIAIMAAITYYVAKKTNWFGEIPENSQNV